MTDAPLPATGGAAVYEPDATGVLIILPTLNEISNIDALLHGIRTELGQIEHTVCVIDDGSVDGTVERVLAAPVDEVRRIHLIQRTKTGRGSQRGSALKVGLEWGLLHTDHGIFIEMDGDLSHRPEELHEGIRLVRDEGFDVAIGSKYVPGSRVTNRSFGRRLVSRISSVAVGCVVTTRIKDYSNGYRFYNRRAARIVANYTIRYSSPIYLSEVLALWLKKGLRVVEFPTVYVGRNEGLSKLRMIDLLKAGIASFEIGARYHLDLFTPCTSRTSLTTIPAASRVTDVPAAGGLSPGVGAHGPEAV